MKRAAKDPAVVSALLAALFMLALRSTAADPSALPEHKPTTLRSRGNDQMAHVLKYWQDGFGRFHRDMQFANLLKGSASGMYGVELRTRTWL